ncbi:flagellar hook protein FlgE [Burkholderia ambifaria]|uniref:flagellar hook protein FlgE n=1 Tax=Burkholderia ambifaria TaxID=152480 RepID=UPI00158C937F|nr:flagellar hook-basal body complex protein [Burkholderia ambifaria]
MLESIYIGMSGLNAYSKGLQTISNNVANLNTAGFKTSTPQFADLYYGQQFAQNAPGSMNTLRAGTGVEYGYASLNFTQGDLRSSSGQLDLAIQGNGFLTLLDGQTVRYARTGQFAVEDDGTIRDKATGLRLATLTASGGLAGLSVAGTQVNPPQATTVVHFSDNLSTGATSFSIPNIDVYDANGGKHTLKIDFKPDSSIMPGRWKVSVSDENSVTVQEDSLQFIGGIVAPGRDKINVTLRPKHAEPFTVSLDFSSGVTSFSAGSTSTLRVASKNGYPTGMLSSLSVDQDGLLNLKYSNGQTNKLGAIALASFSNPRQLVQMGNGLFDATHAAGPDYRASNGPGVGTLRSGATEASNVDLSTEFGQLILIQRGFQASSQVISTANEMIMQLFQMRGQG